MGRSKLQRGLALALTAGLVLTSMPVTAKAAVKSAYTIGVGKRVTGSVSARITKVSVKNKKVATVTKTARKKFRIVFCKPKLAKVAKYFWRMLHLQNGESCNGLISPCGD